MKFRPGGLHRRHRAASTHPDPIGMLHRPPAACASQGLAACARRARWRPTGTALVALVALVMAGCQSRPESPPAPTPAPEPAATPAPAPPAGDVSTAIDLLQGGDTAAATRLLEHLAGQPDAALAERLLNQVQTPAASLIPPPYREIRVQPGETLSEIANRTLGDPLMFVALARLNDVTVPRRLAVGRVLRVPVAGPPPPAAPADRDAATAPAAEAATEAETIAAFLARSGEPEQARAMLARLVGQDQASPEGRARFVELTLEQAREALQREQPAEAVALLDEAHALLADDPQQDSRLASLRRRAEAIRLGDEARRALSDGELQRALALAERAVDVDPESDAARRLAARLRERTVEGLHADALVAWRERDVDRAIRTWEALLRVAPEFEPARVYLERARRLRERLDRP